MLFYLTIISGPNTVQINLEKVAEIKEHKEELSQPNDYLLSKVKQVKALKRQDSSMCMIASPDCSLTPRKERKCPSPFEEESELDIIDTIADDFEFDDMFEKDFDNSETHDLLHEFRRAEYLDLDSKVKKPKPLRRKDTSSCIIAPADFRLTPSKLKKCPSIFTKDDTSLELDNILSDVDMEPETDNTPNKLDKDILSSQLHSDTEKPQVTILVTLANDEDESDYTCNKEINEFSKEKNSKIITKETKKKPSVETDIRVKNYAQSLIPINTIRHRFRVQRREEDVEDFLNYV